MDAYLQLTTVFLSGVFGLLVSVVTSALTRYTESRSEHRDVLRAKRTRLENLYTEEIAIYDKSIRFTRSLGLYSSLYDDMARINASMRLLSTADVIKEAEAAGDLLYEWSSEHRAGMPKPIGDSGTVIVSNHDSKHSKRADELYPKLHEQINRMILAMQSHLAAIEA